MKPDLRIHTIAVFALAAYTTCLSLQSCSKSADPVLVKSVDIAKSNTNVPLFTGNSNGKTTDKGGTSGGGDTGGGNGGGGDTGGGTGTGGGDTGGGSGGGGNTGGGTDGALTVSNDGNGGVAIGDNNTIIFKLKGTTYTLRNASDYIVQGVLVPIVGFTTLVGTSSDTNPNPAPGIDLSLLTSGGAVGVVDLNQADITLADGTTYTLGEAGKINYNTYSVTNQIKITTKGTFDMIMVNTNDPNDKIKVSGSFNLL